MQKTTITTSAFSHFSKRANDLLCFCCQKNINTRSTHWLILKISSTSHSLHQWMVQAPLGYFHFMLLYTFTPLHFGTIYYTFTPLHLFANIIATSYFAELLLLTTLLLQVELPSSCLCEVIQLAPSLLAATLKLHVNASHRGFRGIPPHLPVYACILGMLCKINK